MNKLVTSTAVALLLGLTPAFAADNSPADQQGTDTGASAPATQPGATPEASKSATEPSSGAADTSGGATERSSAPPGSGAASQTEATGDQTTAGGADTSGGAMERSSAPPESSAAEPSKPNPTLGTDDSASTVEGSTQFTQTLPSDAQSIGLYYNEDVYDSQNNKIGDVNDVLLDKDGKATTAMVGVGGFLGVGEKDVAVPFSALKVTEKDNDRYLVINTTKEALQSAPGYTYDSTKGVWMPAKQPS
jgi:sporulation protein YlmC with PRC-barrel domain